MPVRSSFAQTKSFEPQLLQVGATLIHSALISTESHHYNFVPDSRPTVPVGGSVGGCSGSPRECCSRTKWNRAALGGRRGGIPMGV
jgi:hypothetical protein